MTTRRALGLFASRLTSNRRSVGALNTSTCFSTAAGSDASSFVDVEAAQERARLKAAALAAQAQADGGAMYVFDLSLIHI